MIEGWVWRSLEEIASIKQGKYLGKGEMHSSPTMSFSVPVIGANGVLGYTNSPSYSDPVALVTCRGNGCGLVQWLAEPSWVSNNAMALNGKHGFYNLFIRYMALGTDFSDVTTGSAQPQITVGNLAKKRFLVPPLDEQRRIAGVLGALDDLIEVNRGLARDCEQLAQSLAASSPSTVSLSSFATWGGLSAVKPVGRVDHYSLPAFDDGRNPERVDGSSIKSNKQQIADSCVLVARLNPHIPRVWMVYPDQSVPSLASTEFVPVVGDGVSIEVIYALCSAPAFLEQMNGLVTGTTGSHQRVDKEALTSVDVPDVRLLSEETLDAIALLVRQAHALGVEIKELAATRDELLPLLMSGRVRVAEEVAA